jgi:hypothetical protein
MMLAFRYQPQKKAVYQRGVIACGKCAAPIHIHKLNTLADEFSVHCRSCGSRMIYSKPAMGIEELPERRRKPRR